MLAIPASAPATPANPAAGAPPPAPPAGPPGTGPEPTAALADVREAAHRAAAELKSAAGALEFSVDAESGETVITVMDAETRTVLRTIPTPEILEIRRALERMQGILIRLQA